MAAAGGAGAAGSSSGTSSGAHLHANALRRIGKVGQEEIWVEFCSTVRKLERQRADSESLLHKINKTQSRIGHNRDDHSKYVAKLKKLYAEGLLSSKKEFSLIQKSQEHLAKMVSSSGGDLPIFRDNKSNCPPLCGPTPAPDNFMIPPGYLVAARTTKDLMWILGQVIRYTDKNKYEVKDIEEDAEDSSQQPKIFTLSPKDVIPLPTSLPDPNRKPPVEFEKKQPVLALYPGSTCFYRATVIVPPSKRKGVNEYLVEFDEDDPVASTGAVPQWSVDARFVLAMPKLRKKDTL